ncbi:hypothetical protein BGZ73_002929 [Actinomortierella ambigua]|nr:hypothetical protein BGZ73_002929 [Actinomortierella ambigua]
MAEDDGFDDFEGLDDLAALDDDSLFDDSIHAPKAPILPLVAPQNKAITPLTASTNRAGVSVPVRHNGFGLNLAATGQKAPVPANHPPKTAKDYFSQFRNGGKGPTSPATPSNALPSSSNSTANFHTGSTSTPRILANRVSQAPSSSIPVIQQDDFEGLGDLDDEWLDEGTQDATVAVGAQSAMGNSRTEIGKHTPAQVQNQQTTQAQTKLFSIFDRQQTTPSRPSPGAATLSFRPSTNQLMRTASSTSNTGSASGDQWVSASDKNNDFTSSYFRSPERAPTPSAPARPTHHVIDRVAALTWKYPNNYPKRDYQFNITRRALFKNTLVSLPTGLGKTFIAAVVMLNYYRWFPESKIIFMAPTRPLVSQQIEACFKICGIPQRDTIEMTGQQNADIRREAWITKRVVFCTPQILKNDLQSGICAARSIVCLVVDEAHRATGNYAFSEVVRLLAPVNPDVRILALTATPGSDIKTVQQVVTNLNIACIELRTEDSMDLRPYVFQRVVQEIVVPLGKTLSEIRDEFKGLTKQYLEKLSKRLSTLCSGIIHAYELLTIHGLRPFFVNLADPVELARVGYLNHGGANSTALDADGDDLDLDDDDGGYPVRGRGRGRGGGGGGRGRGGRGRGRGRGASSYASSGNDAETSSLAKKTLQSLPAFGRLMNRLVTLQNQPNFIGHPKLERLVGLVVEHFVQHQDRSEGLASRSSSTNSAGDGNTAPVEPDDDGSEDSAQTRIMIFANYRESVEEITRVLDAHRPMIRVSSFVGQASAKGKKGITQKEQQKVVADFQRGHHNVLVATSIGEEGLDIGDVDLIICYDSHSSPIRMLQRMGRTGRKRKGKICLLLSEGQEEQKYRRSVTQYKSVQKSIASGSYLEYYKDSPRLLPPGPYPQVDMVRIEAEPYEDPSASRAPRKRRKLDDGTESVNASAFLDDEEMARFQCRYLIPKRSIRKITFESASQALVKRLGKVFDRQSISKNALDRSFDKKKATAPGLDPTSLVGHSSTTQAFVQSLWQLSASRSELLMQAVGYPSRDEYGMRMMSRLSLNPEEEAQPLRKKQPAPRRRIGTKQHQQQQQSDSKGSRQLDLHLFCSVIDSTSESDQTLPTNDQRWKDKGKGKDVAVDDHNSLAIRPRTTRPPAQIIVCSDDDDDDFEIMRGLDDMLGLASSRRPSKVEAGAEEWLSAASDHGIANRSQKRTLSSSQSRKRRLLDSSDDSSGEMYGIIAEQDSGPDEGEYGNHLERRSMSPPLVFDFASSVQRHPAPRSLSHRKSAVLSTTLTSTNDSCLPLPEQWFQEDCHANMLVDTNTDFTAPPKVMVLPPVPAANMWYQPAEAVDTARTTKSSDEDELPQRRPPRRIKDRVIHLDDESSSEEEKEMFSGRFGSGERGMYDSTPLVRRHEQLKKDPTGIQKCLSHGSSPGGSVVLSSSGGNDFVEINDDDLAALMDDF